MSESACDLHDSPSWERTISGCQAVTQASAVQQKRKKKQKKKTKIDP